MLSNEYVPKVCSTFGAANFCTLSIGVWFFGNCTGNFFVKTWPATVGFELIFGVIQGRAAAFADVGAFFPERKEFARERCFGGFVDDNAFLFLG